MRPSIAQRMAALDMLGIIGWPEDVGSPMGAAIAGGPVVYPYSAPPVTANLTADYAAEVGIYLTSAGTTVSGSNGDPVGRWEDQSGNARHVTQATAGARPTWRLNQINGLPTLEFDGTDDRLFNAIAISNYITNAAFSTYAVWSADAINTNAAATYDNDSVFADQAGGYWGLRLKSAPTAHVYNWDGTDDQASVIPVLGTFAVYHTRHDTGNILISKDGGAEASAASGNTDNVTNVFGVGRNHSTAFFDGHIARILIYNVAHSTTDRDAIIAYLKTRYGIA